MKTEIRYKKCSDIKRVFAFLIDFFLVILSSILVFGVALAIYYVTPSYKENINDRKELEDNSFLFIDGVELDDYYASSDLTFEEQIKDYDSRLYKFYNLDLYKSELENFNKRKLSALYNSEQLFIEKDGNIIFNDSNIPVIAYMDFFEKEYKSNTIYVFRNEETYKDLTFAISVTILILIIISFILMSLVFYFFIPLFNYRYRQTLGMKIFKLGIISHSNYSLTNKEFCFRFLFFFIVEYLLGFLSFFIISLVSFSFMLLGKKKEPFHDLLFDSKMIDVSTSKIYRDQFELLSEIKKQATATN